MREERFSFNFSSVSVYEGVCAAVVAVPLVALPSSLKLFEIVFYFEFLLCFTIDFGNVIASYFSDILSILFILSILNFDGNIAEIDEFNILLSCGSCYILHSHIIALSLFSIYLLLKENKI